MNIIEFVKKLFASFGKKDVREKVRMVKQRLTTTVMVSMTLVEQSVEYNEDDFKSVYGKGFMVAFKRFFNKTVLTRKNPFVSMLKTTNTQVLRLLDLLDEYVEKQLDETIQVEGITYRTSTVLRLIELLDFYVDYSIRHMSSIVTTETNLSVFDKEDGNPFSKAEAKYLQDNLTAYLRLIELFNNDPKKILGQVANISDSIVLGDENALAKASSNDPLRLQFVPIIGDIALWRGKRQVDLDNLTMDRSIREERSIRMRLEALDQKKRTGQHDARTQMVIDNYERQLTLVRSQINTIQQKSRGL